MQKREKHEKCVVSIPTSEGGNPNHSVLQIIEVTSTAIDRLIPGEQAREGRAGSYATIVATKREPVGRRRGGGAIKHRHRVEVVKTQTHVPNSWNHGIGRDNNDTTWSLFVRDTHPIHEQTNDSRRFQAHFEWDGCELLVTAIVIRCNKHDSVGAVHVLQDCGTRFLRLTVRKK
jgi:hypothetical protein